MTISSKSAKIEDCSFKRADGGSSDSSTELKENEPNGPVNFGSCTGKPCKSLKQCRSKWGSCGGNSDGPGDAWCNAQSTWSKYCAGSNEERVFSFEDPEPMKTKPPKQVNTPHPTQIQKIELKFSVNFGSCTGKPCNSLKHCRSTWGSCAGNSDGSGDAWCNQESTWSKHCIGSNKETAASSKEPKTPKKTSPPAKVNPPSSTRFQKTTKLQSKLPTQAQKSCSTCGSGHECIANANSAQAVNDAQCAPCANGQIFWPCNVEQACWCWKRGTAKVHPVKPSGKTFSSTKACSIFTRKMYDKLVGGLSSTYTYDGFCAAVSAYNNLHSEKVFGMGTVEEQKGELAAFLGNTMHESDMFLAPREYLPCGDNKVFNGKLYCKPCSSSSFDWGTKKCLRSLIANGAELSMGTHGQYCQPTSSPKSKPPGCACGKRKVTEVSSSGPLAGYFLASESYFGRGAIQLSWNYNYIRASMALTGDPSTLCKNPDLIATNPKYAWGAGIWYWMEHSKASQKLSTTSMTCHTAALNNDFGDTLFNINGGLECPPAIGGYHQKAVLLRLNRYCKAASVLGVKTLMAFQGCRGLGKPLKSASRTNVQIASIGRDFVHNRLRLPLRLSRSKMRREMLKKKRQ